jgi:hypothetical protein
MYAETVKCRSLLYRAARPCDRKDPESKKCSSMAEFALSGSAIKALNGTIGIPGN